MSDAIDQYIDSSAKARKDVLRRLAAALCLSIVLHAGLLLSQAGDLNRQGDRVPRLSLSTMTGHPAPITVRLAPFRLRPAHARQPENNSATLPPQMDLSPSVADTGSNDSEVGDAPHQVATPAPTGLPAPSYFDTSEVTIRAKPLGDIDLDLPELATISGDGRIILFLYINESGYVDKTDIDIAEPGEILAHAVAHQFGKSIFEPAQIDGHPVKSRVRVEVVVRPLLKR